MPIDHLSGARGQKKRPATPVRDSERAFKLSFVKLRVHMDNRFPEQDGPLMERGVCPLLFPRWEAGMLYPKLRSHATAIGGRDLGLSFIVVIAGRIPLVARSFCADSQK